MIKRQPILPPEFIYPIDNWRLIEKRFAPELLGQTETIFSTANGYLGMRGGFEEGTPKCQHGTFINGFYETWPIPYGERAFGFATTGQTIVNVPDGKIIRLFVDDEPFDLESANIIHFQRSLDMRDGTLDREVLWETPSGRRVLIQSRRLISFHEKHLAAIDYSVTVLNAKASLVVSSEIVQHPAEKNDGADPRQAPGFKHDPLLSSSGDAHDLRLLLTYTTQNSRMSLGCGIDHTVATECQWSSKINWTKEGGSVVFSIVAEPGLTFHVTKYITYHTSRQIKTEELRSRSGWTLDRAKLHGFEQILADQRAYLDDFWDRSDVEVSAAHPRAQQSMRWNLFQLIQAAGRADRMGIPAKGLTGQAYEGQYFWDMDMYVLPFLTYTSPRLARNLLMFRYNMLDHARQRARTVSQKGALFPWRTINGEEASAYYAASTAQYHINAAIAFGLRRYVQVTGDREFLFEYGAEILVETARLWYDLGFFSDRKGGQFCIHGVTGPDEYTTVVNNNTYTNLMARENLLCAVWAVNLLRNESLAHFAALKHRTKLEDHEIDDWQRAADRMYIPYDELLGIHPQDDSFLDRKVWDLENTPPDKFPLLLHYHPLVIYRHQVLKQADVVLALFLLSNQFSKEQMARDFDYYDPLTTGDSSLSACIQSIVAADIGYEDKALEYLRYALLMDLADVGGNVKDGCHIASMGGTWMAMTYGLAGMRDHGGQISFDPKIPVENLRFHLTIRGQKLIVSINGDWMTYLLREGSGLSIWHRGKELRLKEGVPVTEKLSALDIAELNYG